MTRCESRTRVHDIRLAHWNLTHVHRWESNSSSARVAVRTMSTRALAAPRRPSTACCATPRRSAWASRFPTRAWPGVCSGHGRRTAPAFFVQAYATVPRPFCRESPCHRMRAHRRTRLRRIGGRHLEGGRAARGELQPGQCHARDPAQDLSEPSGGDGQPLCAARSQRHHRLELLQHNGSGGGAVPPALRSQHERWRHRRGARGLVAAPIHHGTGATTQPADDHGQCARRTTTSRFATEGTFSRHHACWQWASRRIEWDGWGGGQHVRSRDGAHGRRQQRANSACSACGRGGGGGQHRHLEPWHGGCRQWTAHGHVSHAAQSGHAKSKRLVTLSFERVFPNKKKHRFENDRLHHLLPRR